jgi:hypothetical protein
MSPKGQCISKYIAGEEPKHSKLKEHCIAKLAKQQTQLIENLPKVGGAGSASEAGPSMLATLLIITVGGPLVAWKMRDPIPSIVLGKTPLQSKSENEQEKRAQRNKLGHLSEEYMK